MLDLTCDQGECGQADCHEAALQLVTGYVRAVDCGDPPPQALCIMIAEALRPAGTGSVHLEFGVHDELVNCWPPEPTAQPSRTLVQELLTVFPRLIERIRQDATPFSAAVAQTSRGRSHRLDVAVVPLSVSTGRARLVALHRAGGLSQREIHVLSSAQSALAALDRMLSPWSSASTSPVSARPGSESPATASPATGGPSAYPCEAVDALVDSASLTQRELQVLAMLADGLLARTIAFRLNVSARTVHKHLESIYRKLEAHDRLLAVDRARAMGLLATPGLVSLRDSSAGRVSLALEPRPACSR